MENFSLFNRTMPLLSLSFHPLSPRNHRPYTARLSFLFLSFLYPPSNFHIAHYYAQQITLHHTTSHYITLHHTTSHYITLHHTTSHYITPYHTISHHITPYHITTSHHHLTPHLHRHLHEERDWRYQTAPDLRACPTFTPCVAKDGQLPVQGPVGKSSEAKKAPQSNP
jgi:hypothetical protein